MNTLRVDMKRGIETLERFCAVNGLAVPHVLSGSEYQPAMYLDTCAFYRPRLEGHPYPCIVLMVDRCAHRGYGGRAWSWPGYVVDRTPFGVLQHELGHHADHSRSDVLPGGRRSMWYGDLSERVFTTTKEAAITGYEAKVPHEWWAEMFRLFVANPDLLRLIRPKTYAELLARFTPIETRPWTEVLAEAPGRQRAAAWKKIAAAERLSSFHQASTASVTPAGKAVQT